MENKKRFIKVIPYCLKDRKKARQVSHLLNWIVEKEFISSKIYLWRSGREYTE